MGTILSAPPVMPPYCSRARSRARTCSRCRMTLTRPRATGSSATFSLTRSSDLDASVRGYDAQSTSKAYLRLDHGNSYIVYGDFLTSDPGTTNSLSNYSRSMTGVKQHFANDRYNLTGFASYDSLTQVVEELLANGTSGPFTLSNPNGIQNSE